MQKIYFQELLDEATSRLYYYLYDEDEDLYFEDKYDYNPFEFCEDQMNDAYVNLGIERK